MDYYEWFKQIDNTCYGEHVDPDKTSKLYDYQDSQIKLGFKEPNEFCVQQFYQALADIEYMQAPYETDYIKKAVENCNVKWDDLEKSPAMIGNLKEALNLIWALDYASEWNDDALLKEFDHILLEPKDPLKSTKDFIQFHNYISEDFRKDGQLILTSPDEIDDLFAGLKPSQILNQISDNFDISAPYFVVDGLDYLEPIFSSEEIRATIRDSFLNYFEVDGLRDLFLFEYLDDDNENDQVVFNFPSIKPLTELFKKDRLLKECFACLDGKKRYDAVKKVNNEVPEVAKLSECVVDELLTNNLELKLNSKQNVSKSR